jgi:hypothetical protein
LACASNKLHLFSILQSKATRKPTINKKTNCATAQPQRKPKDKLSLKMNRKNSLKEDVHSNQTQLTGKIVVSGGIRTPNQMEMSPAYPLFLFQYSNKVGLNSYEKYRTRGMGVFIWMW